MAADERPIFLVGFMGSGKTTVGRRLADSLGWDFVDTDRLVENRAGCSVEEIFRRDGEPRFREIEAEIVAGMDGMRRTVVATGGGLFLRAANRRRLGALGHTIWLDVPLETCRERIGKGAGRPLWHPGDPVAFRAFFDRRAAGYALATTRLQVSSESADELVGRILAIFS